MSGDNLPPFAEGIFRSDGALTELVGSRCPTCGARHFPARAHCPDDMAETETVSLGASGTLYSATVVRTKPPFGLPAPYAVGYVDLDDHPLRIFMLLDPAHAEDFRIGMALDLRSGALGVGLDGEPCIRPYFTPALKD
ncbi:Zn-ribbon domain-containing OB-fold protein [Sphingosinicella microcystinivorans]|uniref:Zn-ribbon domain-containing OB-fold protein n=1 Tax=Sphingosinicella microcystinivorans TaxID=335406 RepID=UPI0022F3BCD2|nr:OB-fold domain-containing protein [Sphingosinicella microcystinivorans]WBX85356.1 OB-fold domain-containing protein [Sphingosinicella microcystinivorans]